MSLTSLLDATPSVRKLVPNLKPNLVNFDGVQLLGADWKTPIKVLRAGQIYEAGTIGTAFDYVSRAVLKRKVGMDNVDTREPIAAHALERILGLMAGESFPGMLLREMDLDIRNERIEGFALARQHIKDFTSHMKSRLDEALAVERKFIHGNVLLEDYAKQSIFLAKLDEAFRAGALTVIDEFLTYKFGKSYFSQRSSSNDELAHNICDLAKAFEHAFANISMSKLHLNPVFNPYSGAVGGADADFIYDSTLIDIKSTAKLSYSTNDWPRF